MNTSQVNPPITSTVVPADPTALTRETVKEEVSCLRQILETRLDGMDKAIELLQSTADKFPSRMDEKIASLQRVHDEKFDSIQKQFSERDVRTEQTSRDSKVAVDAALQAAKEAVGEQNRSSAMAIAKSETATVKQIDQQGMLIQTTKAGLDGNINDIKERLTRLEGTGAGRMAGSAAVVAWVIAGFSILLGVGGLVLAFMRLKGGP